MKWPQLVPNRVCGVPIEVHLTAGVSEDGAPAVVRVLSVNCNYDEKSRQTIDAEGKAVRLSATALFSVDIAPELDQLEGFAFVDGSSRKRVISIAERPRNPDGSVNYTRLGLL